MVHAQMFQLSFFYGLNHIFEYGSEDDYIPMENDFPVTPAHTPSQFGAALAFFPAGNIGIELDTRYILSSEITLQDPSDLDSVKVDTHKHYSVILNLIYRIQKGRLTPYFAGGVGFDRLVGEGRTYTSEYGWMIELLVPEKRTDFALNLGAGIYFSIVAPLGARFDVRYIWIFADPDIVTSLSLVLGVSLDF